MTQSDRGICPRCGQDTTIYYLDEGADVGEGLDLCEDCAMADGWEQCSICGDFYPTYLVDFTLLDDDRIVCEYCMEDVEEEEDEEDEEQ